MGTGSTSPSNGGFVWSILAGAWSLVFAVPHFYWALGGRSGLGAQAAAADAALDQAWFAAYNLAAAGLGIAGAVVAYVIATTSSSGKVRRLLLLACAVASVVLLLRGALGLVLLGVGALDDAPDAPIPAVLLAIEPYFVLGGLAFRRCSSADPVGPAKRLGQMHQHHAGAAGAIRSIWKQSRGRLDDGGAVDAADVPVVAGGTGATQSSRRTSLMRSCSRSLATSVPQTWWATRRLRIPRRRRTASCS